MWTKWTLSVLVFTLVTGVKSTVTPLVVANGDFSMRLYKSVVDVIDDENIFLSPFSVFTAMAMTYAGARGNTAAEMKKALGFERYSVTDDDFRDLLQKIMNSNNGNCTLALANRLFPDKRFKLLSEFVKVANAAYAATPKSLDFAGAADESRRYINKWAADATEQKIKNLLTPTDITPQTALVLANAIYFKASWRTPFDKSKSIIQPFYVSADHTANITMMQVTGKFRFRFDSTLGCYIVELPYAGSRLSMLLVIPRNNDGLPAVESKLTAGGLTLAVSAMKEVKITVKMPKFDITQRFDLDDILGNMGIHDLFTPQADLSGLAEDSAGLAVSGVIHKAFISVNEEGTEAAAATGVVTARARPLVVVADRPFMFVIWDQIGIPLFVGRLVQPPKNEEQVSNPSTTTEKPTTTTEKPTTTTEKSDNSPNAVGRFEPVSLITWLVSFAMLVFVGHAF